MARCPSTRGCTPPAPRHAPASPSSPTCPDSSPQLPSQKDTLCAAAKDESTLDVSLITKANSVQRRGRAGRCQVGLVVHLFPSYYADELKEFNVPEMLSKPLEEVVLQCKVVLDGDPHELLRGSMAQPSPESITNAVGLLQV